MQMNSIYDVFKDAIYEILQGLSQRFSVDLNIEKKSIDIDLIKNEKFGDYSTNVAMVFAKKFLKSPKELGELILQDLSKLDFIESVNIAGPGFINWTVKIEFFYPFIIDILKHPDDYGSIYLGDKAKKINVEFVSANPTGPIHAGHARGAIVGDAIASILEKVGHKVTREYYVNDYGKQVEFLAKSLYARYLELLGKCKFELKPGYYPGEYLIDIARKIVAIDGNKWINNGYLDAFKSYAINEILGSIKEDLKLIGVKHDVFTYESSLVKNHEVEEAVKYLDKQGLIYNGVLECPKGKVIEDWEPREQTLFSSSIFGDDVDRPLKKSDGSWTYFASDIAYHFSKIRRGFDELVDLFGADHGGYISRMKAAVYALNKGLPFEILLTQLVKFVENGQELKMSKRAGTFITARDIVDAVGKDVLRFVMLTRKSEVGLDFDFNKVTEQSSDNPVFYVQYASARTHSIIRQFENFFGPLNDLNLDDINFFNIKEKEEKTVIKVLLDFKRQLNLAATLKEPHRIAFFLYDLSSSFHSLWNMGKCNKKLRFIIENNREVSLAKCMLVRSIGIVIFSGLDVLGVKAAKEL